MTNAGSKMLAFVDIHALAYSKKKFNILYWILQYTWGIILTIIGHIVELALLVSGHKPKNMAYPDIMKLETIGAD